MAWQRAASLHDFARGPVLHKAPPRQIALFRVGARVHAVDNRCPHEGYPLVQGGVDGDGLLTCHWHNWKFRLTDGACVLGGDDVRAYPVELRGDEVWVDVTDPPPGQVRARVMRGLRRAWEERDGGRIARELARLHAHGLDPLDGVREAVGWTAERLEYGMTHAWAAGADWLALHDGFAGRWDAQLTCLAEAVDHMADDALRQPAFPYAPAADAPWDRAAFLDAVERERREHAEALVARAVADGAGWDALEPAFAAAALAHYNDFGHAAIYVHKAGQLVARLGGDALAHVAPALARLLAYATREDLLPEFSGYAPALSSWPAGAAPAPRTSAASPALHASAASAESVESAASAAQRPDARELFGAPVARALSWTLERAGRVAPELLHDVLLEASARHLLHLDLAYDARNDRPVSQNVGWLDVTHAVTFGEAVGALCARQPSLWGAGLLQMACFVGRNAGHLDRAVDEAAWRVDDAGAFLAEVREGLLDHGLRAPIFSAHLVKTARAVEASLPAASPTCRAALLAGLNRFLNSPLKQKHALRTARQAIALVERDFA